MNPQQNKHEAEQPVCFACKNKSKEPLYFWQKPIRGKLGTWWHIECWNEVARTINNSSQKA